LFIIALDSILIKFNVKYMKDKVKEFRDKHPWLDAAAGFLPFVGEAQDAHDFAHAAKKKDFAGMGLSLAMLVIPGFTTA
jgi:hypothetical protein